MDDLISRQAAIDALGDAHFKNYGNAIMVIRALPSAEPKHGKWIRITQGAVIEKYMCSCCHRIVEDAYTCDALMPIKYPYCHCGAKMED